MCMCQYHNGEPNVNGTPGYAWNTKENRVRPIDPPDLDEFDTMLADLPGRCGGLDSHSHHFRVVKRFGSHYLLVRHGGGDERHSLGVQPDAVKRMLTMDDDSMYWQLQMIYHVQDTSARKAAEEERRTWSKAAAEKRIRTRKRRGSSSVKVWIEPETTKVS
jgi:hypothetical protein